MGMYLVCDLTLRETAERFGMKSYGVIGWASHLVRSKMQSKRGFRNKVDRIQTRMYQQKSDSSGTPTGEVISR